VQDQLIVAGLLKSHPYHLYTMEGKVIQSGILNPQNENDRIQLNTLPKGTYLIHIGSDSDQYIQRIVKL
jgi:hypothetical protein